MVNIISIIDCCNWNYNISYVNPNNFTVMILRCMRIYVFWFYWEKITFICFLNQTYLWKIINSRIKLLIPNYIKIRNLGNSRFIIRKAPSKKLFLPLCVCRIKYWKNDCVCIFTLYYPENIILATIGNVMGRGMGELSACPLGSTD